MAALTKVKLIIVSNELTYQLSGEVITYLFGVVFNTFGSHWTAQTPRQGGGRSCTIGLGWCGLIIGFGWVGLIIGQQLDQEMNL